MREENKMKLSTFINRIYSKTNIQNVKGQIRIGFLMVILTDWQYCQLVNQFEHCYFGHSETEVLKDFNGIIKKSSDYQTNSLM